MMVGEKPEVFMLGGPNGAGKTTAALSLLPHFLNTYEFVNADEIARGLNPINPPSADIMAGRVMIERIRSLIHAKTNFAFETTCAGRNHLRTLQMCKEAGYNLNLFFFWLPTPKMAIDRVSWRVKQGGHDIPADTIHRRYWAGLRNLVDEYLPLVDRAFIFDATAEKSSARENYTVILEKMENGETLIHSLEAWRAIERAKLRENHV